MRSVADLVPAVGGTAFKRFGFAQGALVARWAEIVGTAYARHSRPESLRFPIGEKSGGTLEIAITGALAPMLKHVAPQLIERVNRVLGHGAVAKIRLQHADIDPPPAAPLPGPPVPLSAETRSTLREIADPQLRATLEALAQAMAEGRGPPVIK
ncbi:hypothetical protein GCM10007973_04590 [Polymorphobacter multimanifer]|uniref:DUF721 domain-containing protein n=1 Tax=Polymorphobacter multimanifer TaxID=1070431 RepID=UPI0019A2E448|nr:DUF721 domain-containing protein [Polymorphobacter multimanifer]GGI70710.1 hypothetical protein GCM10007973_04590 [Polymorphobacter multimanifer]